MSKTTRCAVLGATMLLLLAGCGSDGGGDEGTERTTTTERAGGSESGELSVLSYNVAGLPQEISEENPEKHLPIISPMLNDFDVVLTQEDFDWWGELASGFDFIHYHERLRADTTHEYKSPKHPGPDTVDLDESRPPPEVGDGLGVLSRFRIEGNTRVPWTSCFGGFDTSDGGAGDCLAMKGFSLTRLTLADGAVADLYNLHGEAGGGERDQRLQADGYRQLGDYISENGADHAIILGGDTNLHTDLEHPDGSEGADISIWEAFLEDVGLTDACSATDCDGPGRIDKIAFRSGDGITLQAVSHEFHGDEFVDEAGEPLSDHEPLEVRFRWSRA